MPSSLRNYGQIRAGFSYDGHAAGPVDIEPKKNAAHLAENSTPLWSHHTILLSDETWLPEWGGKLGGVQRWRSSVAGCLGQASLSAYGVKPVG
jgi:hypothetical protein